jgi:hypothetical protein
MKMDFGNVGSVPDPGMVQCFFDCDPPLRIRFQHSVNEILGFVGDIEPELGVELKWELMLKSFNR